MNPRYFETVFLVVGDEEWPDAFAIITAYPPGDAKWPPERIAAADETLASELGTRCSWVQPLVGCSPDERHCEPSYAVTMPFADACAVGARFKQDAIFYVENGDLYISHCSGDRKKHFVSRFAERVRDQQSRPS